ncbi:MAG: hypothetical protein ACRDY7_01570 [Acidimicrobiia bacterium]
MAPAKRKSNTLKSHDGLLRAEARARRREGGGLLRRRIGWSFVAVGLLLFVVGYLSAVASVDLLPFDRHHVVLQLTGALLAAIGVGWTTRS